jgi:CspA family cold shock protein
MTSKISHEIASSSPMPIEGLTPEAEDPASVGAPDPHVKEALSIQRTSASTAVGPQTISQIFRPSRASSAKQRGTVTSFNVKRGYGFISRDQGGRDAYVETSTLARCGIRKLSKGQRVIVRVVESGRGPKAVWLRLIGLGRKQLEC